MVVLCLHYVRVAAAQDTGFVLVADEVADLHGTRLMLWCPFLKSPLNERRARFIHERDGVDPHFFSETFERARERHDE